MKAKREKPQAAPRRRAKRPAAEADSAAAQQGEAPPQGTALEHGEPSADGARPARSYLAPEMDAPMQPGGQRGGGPMKDPRLRQMAQELWKKFKEQEPGRKPPEVNAAGEWWGAGLVETVPTSSTPEEIARHRNKLIFRANSLKAALDATLTEIERLARFLPADSPYLAQQPLVDSASRSKAGLQDDLPGAGGSTDDDGTGRIT